MYRNNIKRLLDLIISGMCIIILFPFFLLICILIRLESKGSPIFIQKRVGQHGKEFKIFKFRTMLRYEDSFNPDGTPIENYDRVTRVGNILRKTSIDELPQLLNIFLGDMSIVGPRPTLPYQVEKYAEHQLRRLDVKPGLTGLAQINGRNSITWEKKIQYDLEYIERLSITFDIKIILKTIFIVFKSEKVDFVAHDEISKHSNEVIDDVYNT